MAMINVNSKEGFLVPLTSLGLSAGVRTVEVTVGGTNLSGGPAHASASEEVQVEVEDGLAGACAVVHDCAVAGGELAFGSELRGDELQAAEQESIGGRDAGERFDVLARADQDVGGSLRVNVFEGEDFVVLVNELGGDLCGADFAEEAIAHWKPPIVKGLVTTQLILQPAGGTPALRNAGILPALFERTGNR
jgi:hypothetical protein